MADYVQTTFFGPKDSLSPGDPLKIIKGTEFDAEFDAVSDAIETKVDTAGAGIGISAKTVSVDIDGTTVAAAVDATVDTLLMYDANVGLVRKVVFDDLYDAATLHVPNTRDIIAGAGLTGGGNLTADRTLTIGAGTGITVNADSIQTNDAAIVHDSLSGFVANEHIDHSSVSITAGTGMSGGGTIAATRTLNLDISGLTDQGTTAVIGTDGFLIDDGGTMKRMSYNEAALPLLTESGSQNFATTDVGCIVAFTGTTATWTMPTSIGANGCFIIIINSGSGTLTIAGSGVTVTSANGLLAIPAGGMAVLIRESSTVWFLGGSLQ